MRCLKLLTAIFIIGIAALSPSAQGANTFNPCKTTTNWTIGTVDQGFGISAATFKKAVQRATARWNRAAARVILAYRPKAPFTVNLRYSSRQRTAQVIQGFEARSKQRLTQLEQMKSHFARQQAQYSRAANRLRQRFASLDREIARHNAQVQQRRTPTVNQRQRLQVQESTLRRRQAELQREQKRVTAAGRKLDRLREAINTRVAVHNQTETTTKRTVDALPKEALKIGVAHINGPRSKIELYQYYNAETLYISLLHEFGHTLGLRHLPSKTAVMHATRSKDTAKDLTQADIDALWEICRN